MMKRISVGLAVAAGLLGGFAGVRTATTPNTPTPESAARPAAVAITCSVSWASLSPPDPIAPTREELRKDPKAIGTPARSRMHVTHGPNGTLIGEMTAPYATEKATKTCAGGSPLDVAWESSVNGKRLDDLWFLNSSSEDLEYYDTDPFGVRSWRGVVDPATAGGDVTFVDPPDVDIRFGSKVWNVGTTWDPDTDTWTFVVEADYYSPKQHRFIVWPGIAFQPMYACRNSSIWQKLGPSLTTNSLGRVTFPWKGSLVCPDGNWVQLRVTLPTTPSVWGGSKWIWR